jgi:hypothetical protein
MTDGREIVGKKAFKRKATTGNKHSLCTCKKEATVGRKQSTHAKKKDLTIVGLGFL